MRGMRREENGGERRTNGEMIEGGDVVKRETETVLGRQRAKAVYQSCLGERERERAVYQSCLKERERKC